MLPYWESIASGILESPEEVFQVLTNHYPDEMEQAKILLHWYEAGAIGSWWYDVPTLHDRTLLRLLNFIPDEVLDICILHKDKVLLGAIARYLCTTKKERMRGHEAGKILFDFCLQEQADDEVYPISQKLFRGKALAKVFKTANTTNPDANFIKMGIQFSFNLLERISQYENRVNILISPYSILYSFLTLYFGAKGETKKLIGSILNLPDIQEEELDVQNAVALVSKQNTPYTLNILTAFWVNQNIKLNENYAKRLENYYNTQVNNLDFASNLAVTKINNWVSDATNGRISSIIEEISTIQNLIITNAIYFHARWNQTFTSIGEKTFYLLDNTEKQTSFMKNEGSYHYFANEQYEAIQLPYKGYDISMEVYLPCEGVELDIRKLSVWVENFHNIPYEENPYAICYTIPQLNGQTEHRYDPPYGTIELPYFSFNYEITLTSILSELGLSNLFNSEKADFSGIIAEEFQDLPIWINEVIHKTFIKVDEQGTEAAAATSYTIATGAGMPPEQTFHMQVNRPFMFVISNKKTKNVLFTGIVVEPF